MTEHRGQGQDNAKSYNENLGKIHFMAKISHELRSPLNSIIGFAELMYHGKVGPISEEHKEYLSDILASSRHLLLIINDILDLAKVESGKMEFHPEKINLKKIMNETSDLFANLISNKKIHFETYTDPSLETIFIDPTRLKQIIYNYVSNALKCTSDGGHVSLRAIPEDNNHFRVEVKDDGIGIRENDLPNLFIEFKQLDREIARKYPSSGLGLALTKHIVESQGGQVGVESQLGKGSLFFAILPINALMKSN